MAILTVLAILLAPLVALQISAWLNEIKEVKKRKMDIFRTLMATRAAGLSPQHVEALNRIDVEFYADDKKTKKVFDAWKIYHDHLNIGQPAELIEEVGIIKDEKTKQEEEAKREKREKEWETWSAKKGGLLTDLLYEMALYFGYSFDKVHIKRGHYYPRAYGDIDFELMTIRKGLVRIFENKASFPILAWVAPIPKDKKTS